MSQDNQNSQRPQKPYQRNQPIWKSTIIQFLRGTIGLLETAVVKLETTPPPGTEETPGFWGGLLAKIRAVLPANLSAKLSDTALTGIIASIAVILIWTTTTFLTNKPAEIAIAPPTEEVPAPIPTPTPTVTTPPSPELATPETPAPEKITPSPEVEVPPPEPEPEPTPTPEPTPEPTPTPVVQLTPEQVLIAAIENQVAEISDRIASGLIKSIQANFRTSNLTVKISDDWYSLTESQQNKLAADILQRSQELDFSHLEVVDFQDRLVARNPVVGNKMIIFKRRGSAKV